jgi:hypothetical protein
MYKLAVFCGHFAFGAFLGSIAVVGWVFRLAPHHDPKASGIKSNVRHWATSGCDVEKLHPNQKITSVLNGAGLVKRIRWS